MSDISKLNESTIITGADEVQKINEVIDSQNNLKNSVAEQVKPLTVWDKDKSYLTGQVVFQDGQFWKALADNKGYNPTRELNNWGGGTLSNTTTDTAETNLELADQSEAFCFTKYGYGILIGSDTNHQVYYSYDLKVPYELSTIDTSSKKTLTITGYKNYKTVAMQFNYDGTKFFSKADVGLGNSQIACYDLSTPFDISTAKYVRDKLFQNSDGFDLSYSGKHILYNRGVLPASKDHNVLLISKLATPYVVVIKDYYTTSNKKTFASTVSFNAYVMSSDGKMIYYNMTDTANAETEKYIYAERLTTAFDLTSTEGVKSSVYTGTKVFDIDLTPDGLYAVILGASGNIGFKEYKYTAIYQSDIATWSRTSIGGDTTAGVTQNDIDKLQREINVNTNNLDNIKRGITILDTHFSEVETEIHNIGSSRSYQTKTYVPYFKNVKGQPKPAELVALGYTGKWKDKNDFESKYKIFAHSFERDVRLNETITSIQESSDTKFYTDDIDMHSTSIDISGYKSFIFKLDPAGAIAQDGGSVALNIKVNTDSSKGTATKAYLLYKASTGFVYARTVQTVLLETKGENFALKEFATEWCLLIADATDTNNVLDNLAVKAYGRKTGGTANQFFIAPHPDENDSIGYGVYPDGAANLIGIDDIAYNAIANKKNTTQAGQIVHNDLIPHMTVRGQGAFIQRFANDPAEIPGLTSDNIKTGTTYLPLGHWDGYIENPAETLYWDDSLNRATFKVKRARLYKITGSQVFADATERIEVQTNVFLDNDGTKNANIARMFDTDDTIEPWQPYVNVKFQYQKKSGSSWISAMTGTRIKDAEVSTNYGFTSTGRPDKVSISITPDTFTTTNGNPYTIATSTPLKGFDKIDFPKLNANNDRVFGATTGIIKPSSQVENRKNPVFTANDWLYLNLWNKRTATSSNWLHDRMMFIHRVAIQFEKENATSMDIWKLPNVNTLDNVKVSLNPLRDIGSRLKVRGVAYLPIDSQGSKEKAVSGNIQGVTNLTLNNASKVKYKLKTTDSFNVYNPTADTFTINIDSEYLTNTYGAVSVPIYVNESVEFTSVQMFDADGNTKELITSLNGKHIVVIYGNIKKGTASLRIAGTIRNRTNDTEVVVGMPKINQISSTEGTLDLTNLPALAYEEIIDVNSDDLVHYDKNGKIPYPQIETNPNIINIYKTNTYFNKDAKKGTGSGQTNTVRPEPQTNTLYVANTKSIHPDTEGLGKIVTGLPDADLNLEEPKLGHLNGLEVEVQRKDAFPVSQGYIPRTKVRFPVLNHLPPYYDFKGGEGHSGIFLVEDNLTQGSTATTGKSGDELIEINTANFASHIDVQYGWYLSSGQKSTSYSTVDKFTRTNGTDSSFKWLKAVIIDSIRYNVFQYFILGSDLYDASLNRITVNLWVDRRNEQIKLPNDGDKYKVRVLGQKSWIGRIEDYRGSSYSDSKDTTVIPVLQGGMNQSIFDKLIYLENETTDASGDKVANLRTVGNI